MRAVPTCGGRPEPSGSTPAHVRWPIPPTPDRGRSLPAVPAAARRTCKSATAADRVVVIRCAPPCLPGRRTHGQLPAVRPRVASGTPVLQMMGGWIPGTKVRPGGMDPATRCPPCCSRQEVGPCGAIPGAGRKRAGRGGNHREKPSSCICPSEGGKAQAPVELWAFSVKRGGENTRGVPGPLPAAAGRGTYRGASPCQQWKR